MEEVRFPEFDWTVAKIEKRSNAMNIMWHTNKAKTSHLDCSSMIGGDTLPLANAFAQMESTKNPYRQLSICYSRLNRRNSNNGEAILKCRCDPQQHERDIKGTSKRPASVLAIPPQELA
ncbi:predicted protein [Histoplasma capsulatum H143]|nr:predicted protein [Histoplasma capsulatum H143]